MFAGFNLKLNNCDLLITERSYQERLEQRTKRVNKKLKDFYDMQGQLDGEALKNEWFPDIKTHVFISHSHKDKELAQNLAIWLYQSFQIESFIDSDVWGFADDLLKIVDNKYAWNAESNTYYYEVRNYTTSHIHLMLSNALHSMMDKSECLIFLNTDNALNNIELTESRTETRTYSPWLMSEINTSLMLRSHEDENANRVWHGFESLATDSIELRKSASFKMHHKVNTEHLFDIDETVLWSWLAECKKQQVKEYDALTYLYRINPVYKNLHNESMVQKVY